MSLLPRLPRLPRTPRLFQLPRFRARELSKPPTVGGAALAQQAATQGQGFEARYAAWGRGTRPEFIVYEFLTLKKKQVEGRDFLFQSSRFGGRRVFGGQVVDFYLFTRSAVWRVQGEFFHVRLAKDRARDLVDRQRLLSRGLTVIDLYAQDLLERPDYVLNAAWQGHEVQRRGSGL